MQKWFLKLGRIKNQLFPSVSSSIKPASFAFGIPFFHFTQLLWGKFLILWVFIFSFIVRFIRLFFNLLSFYAELLKLKHFYWFPVRKLTQNLRNSFIIMSVSSIYFSQLCFVKALKILIINLFVFSFTDTWAPKEYCKNLVITNVTFLIVFCQDLPFTRFWYCVFNSQLSLDNKCVFFVHRHFNLVLQHPLILKNPFLLDSLSN